MKNQQNQLSSLLTGKPSNTNKKLSLALTGRQSSKLFIRTILGSRFAKDSDKDKVPNFLDCQPYNPRKQDALQPSISEGQAYLNKFPLGSPENPTYAQRNAPWSGQVRKFETTPEGKEITTGMEYFYKGNKIASTGGGGGGEGTYMGGGESVRLEFPKESVTITPTMVTITPQQRALEQYKETTTNQAPQTLSGFSSNAMIAPAPKVTITTNIDKFAKEQGLTGEYSGLQVGQNIFLNPDASKSTLFHEQAHYRYPITITDTLPKEKLDKIAQEGRRALGIKYIRGGGEMYNTTRKQAEESLAIAGSWLQQGGAKAATVKIFMPETVKLIKSKELERYNELNPTYVKEQKIIIPNAIPQRVTAGAPAFATPVFGANILSKNVPTETTRAKPTITALTPSEEIVTRTIEKPRPGERAFSYFFRDVSTPFKEVFKETSKIVKPFMGTLEPGIKQAKTFLDKAGTKISEAIDFSSKEINQKQRQLDLQYQNFNKKIETFNSKYTGELDAENYASASQQAAYLTNEKNYLDFKARELEALKSQRERIPVTFFGSAVAAAATTPIDLAKLGLGLATAPVQTVKENIQGITSLPGQFVKNPLSTAGSIAGSIAAQAVIFGGFGKVGGFGKGKYGLETDELARLKALQAEGSFNAEYYSLRLKSLRNLEKEGNVKDINIVKETFKTPTSEVPTSYIADIYGVSKIKLKQVSSTGKIEISAPTVNEIIGRGILQKRTTDLLTGLDKGAAKLGLPVESAVFGKEGVIERSRFVSKGTGEEVFGKFQSAAMQRNLQQQGLMVGITKEGKIPNIISQSSVSYGKMRYKSPEAVKYGFTESGGLTPIGKPLKRLKGFGQSPVTDVVKISSSVKKIGGKTLEFGWIYQVSPTTGKLISPKGYIMNVGKKFGVIKLLEPARGSTVTARLPLVETSVGTIVQPKVIGKLYPEARLVQEQQFRIGKTKTKPITTTDIYGNKYEMPSTKKLAKYETTVNYFLPKQQPVKRIFMQDILEEAASQPPKKISKPNIPYGSEKITTIIKKEKPSGVIEVQAGKNAVVGIEYIKTPFNQIGISKELPAKVKTSFREEPAQILPKRTKPYREVTEAAPIQRQVLKQQIGAGQISPGIVPKQIMPKSPTLKVAATTSELMNIPSMVGGAGNVISTFRGKGTYERTSETGTTKFGVTPEFKTTELNLNKGREIQITKEKEEQTKREQQPGAFGFGFASANIQLPLEKVNEKQQQAIKLVQLEKQKQITKQENLNINPFIRGITSFRFPGELEPPTEITKPKIIISGKGKEPTRLKKAYTVFVKRYGFDVPIAKGLPKGKAEASLSSKIMGTLARSGFIKEAGTTTAEDIPFKFSQRVFRPSKKEPFRIVQRARYSLSSGFEKREIQRARLGF